MAKPIRTIVNVINVLQPMPLEQKTFGYNMCLHKIVLEVPAEGELVVPAEDVKMYMSADAVATAYGSNSEVAKAATVYFSNGYYGKPKYFFVGEVYPQNVAKTIPEQVTTLLKANANYYTITATNDFTDADKIALSAIIELYSKIAIWKTNDTACATSATTDLGSQLKALNYNRSMVCYKTAELLANTPYEDLAVAAIPATADYTEARPALTLDDKPLVGIVAEDLMPEIYPILEGKNINYFTATADIVANVFKRGTLASGYRFDTIQNTDWLAYLMTYNVFSLKLKKPKIPFTSEGLGMVKNELAKACNTALKAGVIGSGYDDDGNYIQNGYNIVMPELSTISTADKANRLLRNVRVQILLSGAMEVFEITNNIYL